MSQMRTEITEDGTHVRTNVPAGVEEVTEADLDAMDDLIFGPVPRGETSARSGSVLDVEEARGAPSDDEDSDLDAVDDATFGPVETEVPISAGTFRG